MARSELSSLAKHSGIYFLGSVLNRAASFILLPLYLNVLTPAEFGWLSVVLASMEILALVLGMGIGAAMVRLLVDCEGPRDTGRVIGSSLMFFVLPSLVVLALAWPGGQLAAGLVANAGIAPELFTLGFATAVFTVLFEIVLSVFRGLKLSWWYTAFSTGKSVLFLVLNSVFLLIFDWGVTGILLGTLTSVLVLCLFALVWFARRFPLSVTRADMRRLGALGLPIVPGAMLDAVFSALDKFYLAALVGPAAVGIYALAARLAHLIRIAIAAPFAQIWTVRRLEVETGDGSEADLPVFRNALLLFLMVFLLACLTLSLISPEVIWLIGRDEYARAADFVPFTLAGLFFYMLKWNFEIGIFAAEKTIWISAVSLTILVLAIPGYQWSVSTHGAYGAAATLVTLEALRAVLTATLAAWMSSLVRNFPFWETIVIFAAAAACYVAVRLHTGPFEPFVALGSRCLALAFYCGVLGVVFATKRDLYEDLRIALGKGRET